MIPFNFDALLGLGNFLMGALLPPAPVEVLARKGVLTLDELEQRCKEDPVNYLVEGLLPADNVHVAVGDSGLGKTPWAYQLGLCVATGRPFLGMEVEQGAALYADLENGYEDIVAIGHAVCSHINVRPFPDNFLLWNRDEIPLEGAVEEHNPALVIIDTLRAYAPNVEGKNDDMAGFLNRWRTIARENHCAVLVLHHPRKPSSDQSVPALEDTPVMEWLQQASGARALINQSNTRIAFDRVRRRRIEAAFVMKSFIKSKGETEAIYIERVLDDDGEPVGYRRIVGVELLENEDQMKAFLHLPNQFRFKQAMEIFGRSDDPTSKWLQKCIAFGLIRKVSHGQYEKLMK